MTDYGYLRQSLDRTGDQLATTRQQQAIVDAGAVIAPGCWLVDNDASASKAKPRKQFERLLTVLRPGDVVWIVRLDRMARRPLDLERLIEAGENVTIRSLGGTVRLDTAEGRAHARILVAFAAMETEAKGERQLLANAQRAGRGIPNWQRTFGYRAVDGAVTVVPREADALRAVMNAVCEGTGLIRACAQLNDAGWRVPKSGALWRYDALRKTLMSARYTGVVERRGEAVRAAWEPLWPEETRQRAVLLLTSPQRRKTLDNRPRHLLTGIAVCWKCGRGLSAHVVHSAGAADQRTQTYRCPGGCVVRSLGILETAVSMALLTHLAETEHARTDPAPDRSLIDAETRELALRRGSLVRLLTSGALPPEEAEPQIEALAARIDELAHSVTPPAPVDMAWRWRFGADAWADMPLNRRRELLRDRAESVTVVALGKGTYATLDRPGVAIVWREP